MIQCSTLVHVFEDGLIVKGERIVTPRCMIAEILEQFHCAH